MKIYPLKFNKKIVDFNFEEIHEMPSSPHYDFKNNQIENLETKNLMTDEGENNIYAAKTRTNKNTVLLNTKLNIFLFCITTCSKI